MSVTRPKPSDPSVMETNRLGLGTMADCVDVLEGHEQRVWHVSWSPDGRTLASCAADRVIRIWRPRNGNDLMKWICVATLEDVQSRTIRSCEFSPCGEYLAAASFDATTVIWRRKFNADEDGGEAEWDCVATLEGHENEVKSVAWSHDGSILATCSRDKSVWLWESPSRSLTDQVMDEEVECECISVLPGHLQDVKFVKWHPSKNILFSASYDDTVRVWMEDVDDWITVDCLNGHKNTVWGIAVEPTGTVLATVSQDKSLKVWEKKGSASRYTLKKTIEDRHSREIFSVDWSADGKRIATGGGDNKIVLQSGLEELNYRVETTIPDAHSEDVNCVRFNPSDPRLLASASDDLLVKIWKV